MNVENQPLVEPSKILLPSMHLKLGLINFVKAMNQEEAAFTYLLVKFPTGARGGTRKEAVTSSVFQGIQFGMFIKL